MGSTPRTNHKPITLGSARRGGNFATHPFKQHSTNTSSVTLSAMQGREKCISARAYNGGKVWVEAAKKTYNMLSPLSQEIETFSLLATPSYEFGKNPIFPSPSITKSENVCMLNPTAWVWGGSRGDPKTLFIFSNDLVFLKL